MTVLGGCSMAWFSLIIVLFLIFVARRQSDDGLLAGTGYNFIGALVLGLGLNLVLTTLFGDPRWSLLGGIGGIIIGGYVVGMFLDSSSGGGDGY